MSKVTWTRNSKGDFSTSKIWRHIAFAASTYIVIFSPTIPWELLLTYLTVVSGSEIGKRIIEARYPANKPGDST